MNPALQATITWMTREQGGRINPPSGPTYSAPVKFPGDTNWPVNVWDLLVRLITREEGPPVQWLAEVQYRMEEAPQHLLVPGAEFELYEGRRCVARGRITR